MTGTSLRRRSSLLLIATVLLGGMGAGMAPRVLAAGASAGAPVKVSAKEVNSKYVFSPLKLKIKVGQTVMWKNTTDAAHTVTSTSAGWTYNKKLNLKASLKTTFSKAGTFHYKCLYHPGMVGTVVVSM